MTSKTTPEQLTHAQEAKLPISKKQPPGLFSLQYRGDRKLTSDIKSSDVKFLEGDDLTFLCTSAHNPL